MWGDGLNNSNSNAGPKDFFEAERIRAQRRMEQIKREIDADPHAALFGRRLNPDPIGLWEKQENSLSNFCRSVFGLDKHVDTQTGSGSKAHAKTADTTGRVKSSGGRPEGVKNAQTKKASSDSGDTAVDRRSYMDTKANDLEFDPISGRMVPRKSETQVVAGEENGSVRNPGKRPIQDDRLGYLSPIERSDESTLVSESAGKGLQHKEPEQQEEHKMTQSGEKEAINMANAKDQPAEPQIQQEAPSDISKTIAPDEPSPVAQSKDDDTRQSGNLAQIIQSGLHPDTLESTKNEGPGSRNKTPKLRIQDSTKQSEPILVEENEELDFLRASDIRASYVGLDQKSDTVDNQALEKDVEKGSANVDAQDIQAQPEQDHLSADEKNTQATACTEARQPQSQDAKATLAQVQDESTQPTNTSDQASHTKPPTQNDLTKYRVLAYDTFTMQVTRADTDSTFPSVKQTLHPAEVLPRLNNPARFLPYFTEMQNDGYEIVSGNEDILVFKKSSDVEMNKTNQPPTEIKGQDESMNGNAELGEQQPLGQPTSTSSPRLSHTPPRKNSSTFGNTIRRMAFAGTATAATCYAMGVVGEYFRTGGQDGRGIDGFTEFESERRHRD